MVVGCGIPVRASGCPTGVSSRQRGTTVEPHPPAQKRQLYLPWCSCPCIQVPGYRVYSCKGLTTVDSVWNHIHLRKRGNSICCGILLRTFGRPVGVSSSQRLATVESHPPAQKRQFDLPIPVRASSCPTEVTSAQRDTTVEPHPPAQKQQFYLPWYSCPFIQLPGYRVSSCQRLTTVNSVWNHIHLCKRCNLFAVVFFLEHSQPSWSTLQSETRQLWNHIHLRKRGQFYLL